MTFTEEQASKLQRAEEVLGYSFSNKQLILSAITHPSATEGRAVKYSYERLEFLGDSILGAIVADVAFERFHELDEGGLTRIKVALVSGASLSDVASGLGFADIIVFGSSETGTGKRGLHSALENVYEAVVAALYLDGGFMALSCACKGDGLFKAAVAVAPVTSWRYYDTIYSELYNGLPQENPAGYNENAPLMLAPLLRDDRTRLLLIHGTADDNVHFQNSAEMIRALTDAGKEFDLMIYPDQNHSMQPDYTRQIRRRMISFVERNL